MRLLSNAQGWGFAMRSGRIGTAFALLVLCLSSEAFADSMTGGWRWKVWRPSQPATSPTSNRSSNDGSAVTADLNRRISTFESWLQNSQANSYVGFASEDRSYSLATSTSATASQPTFNPAPVNSLDGVAPYTATVPTFTAPPLRPPAQADAFLNFGDGPFANEWMLTTGGGRSWTTSPTVQRLFGGMPNQAQQADFTQLVMNRVEQTYAKSGIPLELTTDPNVPTFRSLSVASNTQYGPNPNAVGISSVGYNGFSFIDKLQGVQSVDELAWALSHNVAHELMHVFGVDHHDTTGNFLDAGMTNWRTLTDPNATFSAEAVQDLLQQDFRAPQINALGLGAQTVDGGGTCTCPQCQHAAMMIQPVPEPASLLLWSVAAAGLAIRVYRRRQGRKSSTV